MDDSPKINLDCSEGTARGVTDEVLESITITGINFDQFLDKSNNFSSSWSTDSAIQYLEQQYTEPDQDSENSINLDSSEESAVFGLLPEVSTNLPVIDVTPSCSAVNNIQCLELQTNEEDSNEANQGELNTNIEDNDNLSQADYFPDFEKITLSYPHLIGTPGDQIYRFVTLNSCSIEYMNIKKMITNKTINVISIEKIENAFFEKSYYLKKKQKQEKFTFVEEVQLFHGTLKANVDNICKNNFNWRQHGEGTGHRFGKGVSFSSNAMYAAYYSKDNSVKVLFLVKVLIGKSCVGKSDMVLPPQGFDTTLKENISQIVVVKYEDNEFYPVYKINFSISPSKKYYDSDSDDYYFYSDSD